MSGETMSETVVKTLSINDLPNELLVSVFNCLDFRSKVSAEQVCRKWREIVRTCLAISNMLFIWDDMRCQASNLFSQRYRNVDAMCLPCVWGRYYLQLIMASYPNLKALQLSLIDVYLKSDVLRLISRNVDSDLEEISLTFGELDVRVDSSEVSQFCEKFPNVRRFQLVSIELNISESCIELMFKMWRKLEEFHINAYNEDILRAFIESPRPKSYFAHISANIQRLIMPSYMMNETAVRELAKTAVKLKKLEIYYQNDFGVNSIDGTAVIGDCLQSITSLKCGVDEGEYDESYTTLLMTNISKLNSLKKLCLAIISDEPMITFDSIRYLKRCSQLRSLTIVYSHLTAECIEALHLFVPNLVSLSIRYVIFDSYSYFDSDYDSDFDSYSDACIAPIKHLKYLTSLELCVRPDLSDKSLTEILESSKNLRRLDVSKCWKISVDIALAAVKIANSKPEEIIYLTVSDEMKQRCDEVVIPKNLVIKCNKYPILYRI